MHGADSLYLFVTRKAIERTQLTQEAGLSVMAWKAATQRRAVLGREVVSLLIALQFDRIERSVEMTRIK